jgi:hypothetical protein
VQDDQHHDVGQQRDGLRQLRLQRHGIHRSRSRRLAKSGHLLAGGLQVQTESADHVSFLRLPISNQHPK